MSAPMKYVPGGPVSNGMLLALTHFERKEAVAGLDLVTRWKLAHLATLGAVREIEMSRRHSVAGRELFAERMLTRALAHVELAALLTGEAS